MPMVDFPFSSTIGEKVMYGKTVSGVNRSTVLIAPDGTLKKHWTKVAKAEQHPAEVLAYIEEYCT